MHLVEVSVSAVKFIQISQKKKVRNKYTVQYNRYLHRLEYM